MPRHAGGLPSEIPVFPLTGALLLPGGKLPLNIFEPRYLAMVEDALGAGRMIGMVQPDPHGGPGSSGREPSGSGLYGVGCLGRLSSFNETEDGRYLVTLTGISRFTVGPELGLQRGYRRVRADYAAWMDDLRESPVVLADRDALLQAVRAYFGLQDIELNWDAIEQMGEASLLISLCMVCPFEPPEKQALLEAPDHAARAAALLALLHMGAYAEDGDHLPS